MDKKSLVQKPLIYSIDDDLSMNRLMEARFTKFGCEIKTFSDAQILLDVIKQCPPKLLVLDLNLGEGFSGFDVIEKIRGEFKFDFPIIVVSSETESTRVAHALEIGATDFVVKPPFRFQFEEKVAEYIQAANLPDAFIAPLRSVNVDFQLAKISYPIAIREVIPLGFSLVSTHLIKKGSSFWLSGEMIKKIVPSVEKVFVTVLESSMHVTEDQKVYHVRVEVDSLQKQTIQDIKNFLNLMKTST